MVCARTVLPTLSGSAEPNRALAAAATACVQPPLLHPAAVGVSRGRGPRPPSRILHIVRSSRLRAVRRTKSACSSVLVCARTVLPTLSGSAEPQIALTPLHRQCGSSSPACRQWSKLLGRSRCGLPLDIGCMSRRCCSTQNCVLAKVAAIEGHSRVSLYCFSLSRVQREALAVSSIGVHKKILSLAKKKKMRHSTF